MEDHGLNTDMNGSPSVQSVIRVLYVDDEEYLLELGRLFLEDTGEFRVDTMTSAQDALKSAHLLSYDVIVSDYVMPKMDGIEFLKEVRRNSGEIPFILFTGRGREEVVIEAINNGVDFYLQKGGDTPSQFMELSHKIKHAVRRKQAEQALRDSEKQLSDIIEFLPDATFAIDNTGRVIAWNRACEEMTGITSAEMLGKGNFEYAIPLYGFRRPLLIDLINEPAKIVGQYYSNMYRTGNTISAETDLSVSHGNRIVTLCKASPLYNQAGEIVGAIESIRDITDAKNTGLSLKESESKFRTLVEYSRDCILIVDFTGIILFFNPTARMILDEDESEAIVGRKRITEYIHPDFLQMITGDLHQISQGIDGYTTQYKLITRKNREIWVEGHGRKIPHRQSEAILISWRDITDRKLAEDVLRESEEKFRSFAELQSQTIFETDLDLMVTYVNQYGRIQNNPLNQDVSSGVSALSYIHPSFHAKIKENYQNLLSGIPYEQDEYPAVRKDGSTYPVKINSSPIYKDDKIIGIRGVIKDLSEQKRIEAELKESEEKFRALVEQSLDGTVITDLSGDLLFVNPRIGKIIGHPHVQDLIGRSNIFSFVLPEFHEDALHDFELLQTVSEGRLVHYQIATMDKRIIWIECTGRMITFSGSPAILLSIHDITKRKKAEDELEEAMNLANLAHWEYDVGSDLFTFNDRFYSLYGTTAEREGGYLMKSETYAREFFFPGDTHMVANEVEKDIQATDPDFLSDVEHRIVRRDGEIRHIHVRIRVNKDAEGRTIKTHGVNQDITERRRSEEVIRKANHQLSLLTGITRHDILNKISTIYATLELVHHTWRDPDLMKYLQTMISSIEDIQALIEFTRVYEELGSHEPQWVHLNSVISRLSYPESFHVRMDLPELYLFADSMIQKVFFNLLDNSIRHGKGVTEIRVYSTETEDDLKIIWEDNGIGIIQDEKEEIFNKGFGKNTGFGLFLAREILSLTDINIMETGVPGTGARFEITVPRGAYRK